LQNHIIAQTQYTILVSTVILSAFVPTLVAQKFFQPSIETMHAWGRIYRQKIKGSAFRIMSVEELNRDG